jgi:hypothetical protein
LKFVGSKLAFGCNRSATAIVSNEFMTNLTEMNKLVLSLTSSASLAYSKKKKQDDNVDANVVNSKRQRSNHIKIQPQAICESKAAFIKEEEILENSLPIDVIVSSEMTIETERDPTTGVLTLGSIPRDLSSESTYFSASLNQKIFAKALSTMDPNTMDIRCDFDVWPWLEAQGVFLPLSTRTHDLSLLELKGESSF